MEKGAETSPRLMVMDMENLRTSKVEGEPAPTQSRTSCGPVDRNAIDSRLSPAPKVQMHFRRAQPSETRELKAWIAAHHYLQSCPPGFVHLYEFTDGKRLIGGMLLGRPSAPRYDPLGNATTRARVAPTNSRPIELFRPDRRT